jgi:hypothetical protein
MVSWKKGSEEKVKVVLDKYLEVTEKQEDGSGIAIKSNFEYKMALDCLAELVEVKSKNEGLDVKWVLREILPKVIHEAGCLQKNIIEKLNDIAIEKSKEKLQRFDLVTSISIPVSFLQKTIVVSDKVQMSFFEGEWPKKYINGRAIVLKNKKDWDSAEDNTKVVVSVVSKSSRNAAETAQKCLSVYRALLCLAVNNQDEWVGGNRGVINKVLLGKYHTVHYEDGRNAGLMFWYEPNHHEGRAGHFHPDRFPFLKKNISFLWKRINKYSPQYQEFLKNALIRYVSAFDEVDTYAAFIKSWGALEGLLANDNQMNKEIVAKRASWIFHDYHFHGQLVDTIRKARNNYIHEANEAESVRSYCFYIQYYFRELIIFALTNNYKSIDELYCVLDTPKDLSEIEKQRKIAARRIRDLKFASKFRKDDY